MNKDRLQAHRQGGRSSLVAKRRQAVIFNADLVVRILKKPTDRHNMTATLLDIQKRGLTVIFMCKNIPDLIDAFGEANFSLNHSIMEHYVPQDKHGSITVASLSEVVKKLQLDLGSSMLVTRYQQDINAFTAVSCSQGFTNPNCLWFDGKNFLPPKAFGEYLDLI